MPTLFAVILSVALALTFHALSVHGQSPGNLFPASTTGELSALKYTNVGGSGTYQQVTQMIPGQFPTCSINPSCITTPKTISGPLAPYDEDMTFNFRGPMNLYNIAIYQPSDPSAATWSRVSSWAANQQPENMVFMNNLGGTASGEWSSKLSALNTCSNVLTVRCISLWRQQPVLRRWRLEKRCRFSQRPALPGKFTFWEGDCTSILQFVVNCPDRLQL